MTGGKNVPFFGAISTFVPKLVSRLLQTRAGCNKRSRLQTGTQILL